MTPDQIAHEITECLAEEKVGHVLGHDDTTIRIRFDNLPQAYGWISNYSLDLDGTGTSFQPPATAWNQPVTVVFALASYDL